MLRSRSFSGSNPGGGAHGNGQRASSVRRKDLSAQALQSAAASDPQWWEPPLYLGHLLIEAGQLTAAIRAYATAVALLPQRSIYAARAYNNMGLAYKRTGDSAASEESYLNSITIDPTQPDAYVNLGTLLASHAPQRAKTAFLTAARLHPHNKQAQYNAGLYLKEENRLVDAIQHLSGALAVDPAMCQAGVHKGLAQSSLGDREAALQTFLKVIEASDGGCALAHSYVGPLRLLHGFNMDVIQHCERAIELDPALIEAYNCLSTLLMVRREYKNASTVLEMLTANGGGDADDIIKLAYAYQNSCNWRYFRRTTQRVRAEIRARLGQGARIASQASWVAELIQMSPRECLGVMQLKAKALKISIAHLPTTRAAAATDTTINRVHVGYCSSDLRDHPVGHALLGLTQEHDRRLFQVSGYSLDTYSVKTNDSTTSRIINRLDHWEPLGDLGFGDAVATIQQARVHILVNTNGFTRGQRNEIWALGAAPLAITLIGASTTIGAESINIQYASADGYSTPPSEASGYGERLVLHPAFHHPSDYTQSYGHLLQQMRQQMEHASRLTHFDFGNFNRLDKLHPENFAVWLQTMRRTGALNSRLGVLQSPPDSQRFLEYESAAMGVRYTRLLFYGMIPKDDHLVRMSSHDLCLDTTSVNGMTTALDVAYGALPMVSTVGERMNNRFAGGVMTKLGLPSLAVLSLKEYEDLAVQLAID